MKRLLSNLKRERLLVISNIAVMTVTFLVFGLFITVTALSQTAIRNLEKQAQVTLFFKDDFPEQSILQLQEALALDERVSEVNYVSKEDAFRIFTELNKDDPVLLESVSASILPASLEIKTKNIEDLSVFVEELSDTDGIEEIKYFEDVIERFRHWSNIAYSVGLALVAIFLIVSFAVVLITLRLTINSKGEELEILKLVGASDSYVKKPLIQQGIFFGLVSSVVASLILVLISVTLQLIGLFNLHVELGFMPDVLINLTVFSVSVSLILVFSGVLLGYLGSVTAIKKYLKY